MNVQVVGGQGARYPVAAGQAKLWTLYGSGPASYSQTTKDALALPAGMYLDTVQDANTVTGTYYVRAIPSASNTLRPTWKFVWYTASTGAEVNNATNLSAETIQFAGTGGEY